MGLLTFFSSYADVRERSMINAFFPDNCIASSRVRQTFKNCSADVTTEINSRACPLFPHTEELKSTYDQNS